VIVLALLLLASAPADRLDLIKDTIAIRRGSAETINISLQQSQAVLDVGFEVLNGGPEVNVALVGPAQRNAAADEPAYGYLRYLPGQSAGSFRFPAARKGDYQVILDGRGAERNAEVRLSVSLLFHEAGALRPSTVSRRRQGVVIALSLLFFFSVSFWSGRRLVRCFRQRAPASPRQPYL
jgi:hypothetical protein